MSKVKNENYINISGWMVNELKLKGNELFIYAIIYGFSQDGQQTFSGSLQYLADWVNSTKQGVLKNLKSLTEKGLIGRNENIINGVKFVEYYTTEFNGVLNNVEQGIKQSLTGGIKQSLPNNTNRDITSNNSNNKIPTLKEIAEYCRERNNGINPESFYDYYQSQNWKKSNGKPLTDWQAGVRTWERNQRKEPKRTKQDQGYKPDKTVVKKSLEELEKWERENGGF